MLRHDGKREHVRLEGWPTGGEQLFRERSVFEVCRNCPQSSRVYFFSDKCTTRYMALSNVKSLLSYVDQNTTVTSSKMRPSKSLSVLLFLDIFRQICKSEAPPDLVDALGYKPTDVHKAWLVKVQSCIQDTIQDFNNLSNNLQEFTATLTASERIVDVPYRALQSQIETRAMVQERLNYEKAAAAFHNQTQRVSIMELVSGAVLCLVFAMFLYAKVEEEGLKALDTYYDNAKRAYALQSILQDMSAQQ